MSLAEVARIVEGPQVKRGDSSAFVRNDANQPGSEHHLLGETPAAGAEGAVNKDWSGGPAVVLTISKQPGADTRLVSEKISEAIRELGTSLPKDIHVVPLYSDRKSVV